MGLSLGMGLVDRKRIVGGQLARADNFAEPTRFDKLDLQNSEWRNGNCLSAIPHSMPLLYSLILSH